MKILLVLKQDEVKQGWGEALSQPMKQKKWDVETVNQTEEAIGKLAKQKYDGIFSGSMNGDWTNVFKEASRIGIPMCILTGNTSEVKRTVKDQKIGMSRLGIIDKLDFSREGRFFNQKDFMAELDNLFPINTTVEAKSTRKPEVF